MTSLQSFRSQIDAIDDHILTLLQERIQVVRQIGQFKRDQGLPYRDAARWEEIIAAKSAQAAKLGLEEHFIIDIWNRIHEESLLEEQKI